MSTWRVVGPMARANLRGHRLQVALIALTSAACGALLTIGLAASASSGNAFDRLWRATNGADLWMYINSNVATPAQVQHALAAVPEVAKWSGPTPQARVVAAGVTENGFGSGFFLRDWPTDSSALGRPLLVAGSSPQAGSRDVVVLDRNLAAVAGIRIGSLFQVPTPAGIRGLRVIGLDATAEQCPYPLCSPQTVYLAPGGLAALRLTPGRAGGQYAVAVRVTRAARSHVDRVRDAISTRLPPGAVAFVALATGTRMFGQFGYATQSGLLLIFALAAAATSALLIIVSIGAAVRADSRRTGLLKAVGLSSAQLRLTALVEYVGVAVVGSAVGGLVGAGIAPHLLDAVTRQFGTSASGIPWASVGFAVVAISVFTALVVLGSVRRSVRMPPLAALRSDPEGNQGATALFGGPVIVARAAGDILAGRGRSVLTGLAIALGAGGLVLSALFAGSMNQFLHDGLAFDGARNGDLTAIGPSRAADIGLVRAQPGVAGVVREFNDSFSLVGSTETLNLRYRDGDTAVLPQALIDGRGVQRPGEVVVGYGLSRKHGFAVGQKLTLVVGGVPQPFRVVGINREVANLGQMATSVSRSLADDPGLRAPAHSPFQYLIRLTPGADRAMVIARIRAATAGLVSPSVVGLSALPPLIRSIIPVTRGLALALGLLTVMGVFNLVFLAIQERRREFGLVRALGMSQTQVLGTTMIGVLAMAFAACLVAMPIAIIGGRAVMSVVTDQVGVGHLAPPVSSTVLAVAPLVILVTALGAIGPAWSASRTSVVGVLRAD